MIGASEQGGGRGVSDPHPSNQKYGAGGQVCFAPHEICYNTLYIYIYIYIY